jgi:hemoglobin
MTVGDHSLYARLGGQATIVTVVDQWLTNATADGRINGRFATADIVQLRQQLVEHLCMVTGGPSVYRGRDMKSAHAGMKISHQEFDNFVEDLVVALDRAKVYTQDRDRLVGLVRSMKKEIVE